MSDGKITFKTDIDNSDLQKQLNEAERQIRKSETEISKSKAAKIPLTKQAKELGVALDSAKAKMESLRKESAKISAAMAPGSSPSKFIDAASRQKEVAQEIKAQEKAVDGLQKKWDSVNTKIENYDSKIKAATENLSKSKETAGLLSAKLAKYNGNIPKMLKSAEKSVKRIKAHIFSLAKRVLVFSVILAGLRKVKEYMGSALKTNGEYMQQLSKLKGAMLTAFQPLYESILPLVIAGMRVLTTAVSALARVFSILGGKPVSDTAESAKNLYEQANAIEATGEAAEKAKRSLAGFDELTQIDTSKPEGGGVSKPTTAPNFEEFKTEAYKKKIDELTAYISGALLALGTILTFSGANIPLGLGLLALGAAGIVAEVKENWGAMGSDVGKAVNKVLLILGGASLAIGAILAFSGVAVPLGIALMVLGAASLATAAVVNWGFIKEKLTGELGGITAIVSSALLVLGIILCFTGVAIPLGIALIAAGSAGLATVIALNWNYITEKVQGVWEGIKNWWRRNVAPVFTKSWWKEKFKSIGDGLKEKVKDGINAAITLFNRFISWVNEKVHFEWDAFRLFGRTIIPAGDLTLFRIPHIPYLAKGAVLPPNRPFLSVVGDQSHGTNVEAPLETIQKAVAAVVNGGMMAGFEANREILMEILEAILGINIGDDVIASAVDRYRSKMAVVNGGGTL